MTLDQVNKLDETSARFVLGQCCGCERWIARVMSFRPYASAEALYDRAALEFWAVGEAGWREAFSHHPPIGARAEAMRAVGASAEWAADEQKGAAAAGADMQDALARANALYAKKFGYIFIVCATGKSAEEMFALLMSRIENDPGRELAIAAAEQLKITKLRLEKLLAEGS